MEYSLLFIYLFVFDKQLDIIFPLVVAISHLDQLSV